MVIEDQTSSVFLPFDSSNFTRFLFLTLKEPVRVFWVKELAAKGSIPGEELLAIIEIELWVWNIARYQKLTTNFLWSICWQRDTN